MWIVLLENNKEVAGSLCCLGDISMVTEDIQKASSKFILSWYGFSACTDLTEARVCSWERKMGHNVLKFRLLHMYYHVMSCHMKLNVPLLLSMSAL